MAKDINFHKVNDVTVDAVNLSPGNTNIYFEKTGRIYVDNVTGTEKIAMTPEAEFGRLGMVMTTDSISDLDSAKASLVPTVGLLNQVYKEISSPDKDVIFEGQVTINPGAGLVFPTGSVPFVPTGMNGIGGGPGQEDSKMASMNIFSQDKVFFSPTQDGGSFAEGAAVFSIDVMSGRVDAKGDIYVKGRKVLTDSFELTAGSIGAAPAVHKHNWSDITGVPKAAQTVEGIVKLSDAISSTNQKIAASSFAVNEVRKIAANALSTNGGELEGMLNFNVSGQRKINFANNDYIGYDDVDNAFVFEADDTQSKSVVRAGKCESTEYAIIKGKKLFIQNAPPSGMSTGDVWIQV